jgi:4-hydroxybenzoate polyprenyltransferase
VLRFPQNLLPLLQLTRMALVFTALADSGCTFLLWTARSHGGIGSVWQWIDPAQAAALMMISIGLYGFGMSLNDIIDQRRDARLAAHRPLPSGRIRPATAIAVSASLAVLAIAGGLIYSARGPAGQLSLMIVGFTLALIVFYDFAGKYLVAPGLLTLGLIRFFHAAIAAPQLPVPWHPLLLLNHITLVSTIAYQWELKRPILTRAHVWSVLGGLAGVNGLLVGVFVWRRWNDPRVVHLAAALALRPGLVYPALAIIAFIALAFFIRRQRVPRRQAGQTLMLLGLLWLIVYDAAFVAAYVGYLPAALILLLLPIAWLSVQLMRWCGRLMELTQRPDFKRVET